MKFILLAILVAEGYSHRLLQIASDLTNGGPLDSATGLIEELTEERNFDLAMAALLLAEHTGHRNQAVSRLCGHLLQHDLFYIATANESIDEYLRSVRGENKQLLVLYHTPMAGVLEVCFSNRPPVYWKQVAAKSIAVRRYLANRVRTTPSYYDSPLSVLSLSTDYTVERAVASVLTDDMYAITMLYFDVGEYIEAVGVGGNKPSVMRLFPQISVEAALGLGRLAGISIVKGVPIGRMETQIILSPLRCDDAENCIYKKSVIDAISTGLQEVIPVEMSIGEIEQLATGVSPAISANHLLALMDFVESGQGNADRALAQLMGYLRNQDNQELSQLRIKRFIQAATGFSILPVGGIAVVASKIIVQVSDRFTQPVDDCKVHTVFLRSENSQSLFEAKLDKMLRIV